MSFISNLTARLPFSKKEESPEHFFSLNIGSGKLTVALWAIENHKLQVINTTSANIELGSDSHSLGQELTGIADRLLGEVLGDAPSEPEKILFGVPDNWLSEEDLKEPYLRLLKGLVKELGLTPMAYVATSHALAHFLEKKEGVPTTAILVGVEDRHVSVAVVRAGKLDGSKTTVRGDNLGADIEKLLLTFTAVEVLPSKILLYGVLSEEMEKHKNQLLSYPWMSGLSFLHFPKIEILVGELEINAVSFAGAVELDSDVVFAATATSVPSSRHLAREGNLNAEAAGDPEKSFTQKTHPSVGDNFKAVEEEPSTERLSSPEGVGFVVGDIMEQKSLIKEEAPDGESSGIEQEEDLTFSDEERPVVFKEESHNKLPSMPVVAELGSRIESQFGGSKNRLVSSLRQVNHLLLGKGIWLTGLLFALLLLFTSYLVLVRAQVKVFVEPRIIEKDTQIVADPGVTEVNEEEKRIPGQVVEIEVSGNGKENATGKKLVGDSAKGTVVILNKTDESRTLNKGTVLSTSNGVKFALDTTVTVASRSAEDGTWGRGTVSVTAQNIGGDGNLPSKTDLTIAGVSISLAAARTEGNFSGGTSREVTVVSEVDTKRLLAKVAGELRKKARDDLQGKHPDKKVIEEALSETIIKKSFSKNINDAASEFSLNLTARYKGVAFEDKDLKLIVSKLVNTTVPEGFELNLADTETQADVARVEKDGKVVFSARFKAKLLPKINAATIKKQVRGKTPSQAADIVRSYENVLGSEITLSPKLPINLARLPLLERNIKVEVGLK